MAITCRRRRSSKSQVHVDTPSSERRNRHFNGIFRRSELVRQPGELDLREIPRAGAFNADGTAAAWSSLASAIRWSISLATVPAFVGAILEVRILRLGLPFVTPAMVIAVLN